MYRVRGVSCMPIVVLYVHSANVHMMTLHSYVDVVSESTVWHWEIKREIKKNGKLWLIVAMDLLEPLFCQEQKPFSVNSQQCAPATRHRLNFTCYELHLVVKQTQRIISGLMCAVLCIQF